MRALHRLFLTCWMMASADAAQIGKPPLVPPASERAESPVRGGTRFGRAVLPLADLDGDGTPEIAVGAPMWQGGGAVLVLSGATRGRLALWRGAERLGSFGHELRPMGDVDGDGVEDVLVGRQEGHQCELWSPAKGHALRTFRSPFEHVFAAGDLDGDGLDDQLVTWPTRWSLRAGSTGELLGSWDPGVGAEELTALEDLDGDGLLDFLVQASAERLILSAAGEDGLPTFACEAAPVVHDHWGPVFGGRGLVVDGAASGDLDGDGRSDLVVSCRHRGAAFIAGLSLADRSTAIMRTPPPGPGHDPLAGSRYRFGYELLCPGDLNGDGAGDVIASGAITIFQVRVAALDAATGGELWSADWSDGGATSGVSLARFADVDGDGAAEVLVGSSDWFWHGVVVPNGTVRLLSGATGEPLWVVGERRYRPGGVEAAPGAREKR